MDTRIAIEIILLIVGGLVVRALVMHFGHKLTRPRKDRRNSHNSRSGNSRAQAGNRKN